MGLELNVDLNKISNDRSNDYKYLYKKILPYAKPYMFRGIAGVLLAIPVGALDGIMPLALKLFFDHIVPSKDMKLAVYLGLGIVLFAIVQGLLKYLSIYLNDWSGRKITNGLQIDLFSRLLRFESKFYDKNQSGLVIARFSGDAGAASAGLLNNFKVILTMLCSALAYTAVLLYNSWELAIIAITALGIAILPVRLIKKKVKEVSHKGMQLSGKFLVTLNEAILGNKIVASYNLQENRTAEYTDRIKEGFNLSMSLTKSVNWLSPASYLIASIGFATVIIFASHLLFIEQLTFGRMAAFSTALLLLYRPIKTIGNTLASMQNSFEAMNRVINLLEIEPSIKDKENAITINSVNESIKFENVQFEYDKDVQILKDINLEVKKGEAIALVGNSGGGKSTFANLISRFYDVNQGSIKIDNIDIKEITLRSLRDNISVVFQDNFLFSGSIKENIMLGKANATDQEIQQVLKDSFLDEFVQSLDLGINTEVGERGTRLSGGQKQRVAIARALIKNAPIVILDEATSALDNKSEAVVQKALDKLMENRTVFVIAHRLSTIRNADRIVVINEGQIVEVGPHDELIAKDGAYKGLYEAQFKSKQNQPAV